MQAFERGPGHALLDLGATELDAPLAPDLAFLRDVGRAFGTRLCAVPDLEERRERVEVDCPLDERDRLAGAVPPMDGAEYVDAEWVAACAFEAAGPVVRVPDWWRARRPPRPEVAVRVGDRSRARSAWMRCAKSLTGCARGRVLGAIPMLFLMSLVVLAIVCLIPGEPVAYFPPFDCHIASMAPVGSVITLIEPYWPTSITSTTISAPSSCAFRVDAWMSSTPT